MPISDSLRSTRWLALLALGFAACSSNGASPDAGSDAGSSGAVAGPADVHCAGAAQPINQADCHLTGLPDGGAGNSAYGATLYNSSGDDDDCKYHLDWSATPIAESQGVTFTLAATYKATGAPDPPACGGCAVQGLTTQNTLAEVFLSATHPAPNSAQVVTALPDGSYTLGPILFDAPGKWTVRFHLDELCSDVAPDSPHGHAAFYVDVP